MKQPSLPKTAAPYKAAAKIGIYGATLVGEKA
jgi:hypothetical protein